MFHYNLKMLTNGGLQKRRHFPTISATTRTSVSRPLPQRFEKPHQYGGRKESTYTS